MNPNPKPFNAVECLRDIRDVINRHLGEIPQLSAIPFQMQKNLQTIIEHVSEEFGMDPAVIRRKRNKRRTECVTWPRFVACYFCRELTTASWQEIGNEFNGYDHGSVIHGYNVVCDRMVTQSAVRDAIEKMRATLITILNIADELQSAAHVVPPSGGSGHINTPTLNQVASSFRNGFNHHS